VPAEQLAVRAFVDLPAFRARARAIVEPNAARLRAFIVSRPELTWVDPQGGTVAFPRLSGIDDSSAFTDRLLARYGTAVVPGRFFEAPRHIRIAFGIDPAVLAPGLEAIGHALDNL
jgi:aspartate/methionine/tyrosine aminotransferase